MGWFILTSILSALLSLVIVRNLSDQEYNLEILVVLATNLAPDWFTISEFDMRTRKIHRESL